MAHQHNLIWRQILLFMDWDITGYYYQEFILVTQGGGGGHFPSSSLLGRTYPLLLLTRKLVMLGWNKGHRKLDKIVHFGHLKNVVKDLKINDSVEYFLQKWIISHPHVIPFPIANEYIAVKFDYGNGGVKTGLHQKVRLQVSIRELHLVMQKKTLLGFPCHMIKKDLLVLVIILFPLLLKTMWYHKYFPHSVYTSDYLRVNNSNLG